MKSYRMPNDAIRDSWVVGYSTKTVIGMWYGYDSFTKQSIADGYVLHNVPATIQKDRLFNALVSAGAMESNREEFKLPSSVVKVGVAAGSNPAKLASPGQSAIYEYFKKGYEPNEYDTNSYKLPAPGNLKATESGGKVTLSWSSVNHSSMSTSSDYGKFGYNIYKDGILIGWTDKTSYSFTPDGSVYGTYKVVATFKSYSGITSESATITLKESSKPSPSPSPSEEPSPSPSPSPSEDPITPVE